MSLAIIGGRCWLPHGPDKVNLLLQEGRIVKISKQTFSADKVIDARNLDVLPGLIDAHVHFREPGQTHKEDFLSGSLAAAAGGITSVLDMPNNTPPILTEDLLDEKRELAKKSIVNYGFHFGSSAQTVDELTPVRVASVKVFFDQSTGKLAIADESALKMIFSKALFVTAHAEGVNVQKAISLAKECGTELSVAHLSLASELDMIRKGTVRGAEVCPHHLFLTKKDDLGPFTKMKPSLKSDQDRLALWQGIKDGTITHIATDHAPHTIEEKESEPVPYGVPGVETMLPMLLDAVNKGLLTLPDIIRLCSVNPAKIFRMDGYGAIDHGMGNLSIVDCHKMQKVNPDTMFSKCGWSPFAGKTLKGWPVHTIVNGQLVYEDGAHHIHPGKEVSYESDRSNTD
ncbi:MAG: amidohydrolase family protein [Nanoarchaeota archaeon]